MKHPSLVSNICSHFPALEHSRRGEAVTFSSSSGIHIGLLLTILPALISGALQEDAS